MQVKISVVIPTYHRPRLLQKCIEALMKQSLDKKHFEVIVISDGPDETTKKIMEIYSKENLVKYFAMPQKKGPAAARNFGWGLATGTLIAFTDDDCIPAKEWLQCILDEYHGEKEIAFTGKVKVPIPSRPTDYELNISKLETAEFVTANCVCTKKALRKVGGFDESFQLAWREDSDLHFKFLEHNIPILKINATVVHPVRRVPWGISIKEQRKGVFNALLYKKYPKLFRERIKPAPLWNYYFMMLCMIGIFLGIFIQSISLTTTAVAAYLILLLQFITKRLFLTSRAPGHVLEIVVTSIFIPFISVYWQMYGAIKFRVLYL